MVDAVRTGYAAECFWDGVRKEDLREVVRRIEASMAAVARDGGPVRYLGWLHIVDDDVVLVLFEGPPETVRRVAEHARIPFGRILQIAHLPWPTNPTADEELPQ
jgi:hypothetical protein